MKKLFLSSILFSSIFLFSHSFAQQNADSLAFMKRAYEKQQHYFDSVQKIKGEAKLVELFNQQPDSVFKIELNACGLTEIPDFQAYYNVKIIYLNNNKLKKIRKKDWPDSDSLQTIDLSGNQFGRIRFGKNSHIKHLNLSENQLKRVPRSIRKLKDLESLNLNKNKIKRIPCFIKRMKSLSDLNLNYNQLKKLSKCDIRKLKHIKNIHIGGNSLSKLPENIDDLEEVRTLNFGINNLSSLPMSFARLDSLEHLIFYRNNFDSIPAVIWELKSLKEMDFYHNQIKEIPEEIGRLKHLEQIFLAYNQISNIPDTLLSLKHLKALYLHHNDIVIIPLWVADLSELKYLDFGFNKIYELPDLGSMTNLEEIDLQGNQLSEFPFELLENKNLQKIFLMGNPFVMTKEELEDMEKIREQLQEMGIRVFF